MLRFAHMAFLTLLALAPLGSVHATGMRVQPGGALIQGWPVGERRELPVPLMIFNDDDKPHTYSLSACKPSEIGGSAVRGYREIPDASWLTFEPAEVPVPAKGHGAARMFLAVPAEERYRNAHWSVSLAVRSDTASGQRIGLALYPRFEIETAAAEGVAPPQEGLAFTPSFLKLDALRPGGGPAQAALKLWNTSGEMRRCRIEVIAAPREGAKPPVPLSQGLSWIPAASWVIMEHSEVELPAGGSVEVPLRVSLPADAGHNGSWEAVLLARDAEGAEAFARVRLASASK